jgi:DNA-binding beta-propeller fold protein YncE
MVLLIASAVLMAIPFVGETRLAAPSGAHDALAPLPAVTPDTHCAVGSNPHFAAYDPVDHEVYVPNSGSSNRSILNGTCSVVATISFPSGAVTYAAGFDPTNHYVYVTDYGLNQVYFISGTKLVTTIRSASFDEPLGVAFDPGDAIMAVVNRGTDTVTLIFGTTVDFTITVGSGPVMFGYDPYYGRFLVSNFRSDNVTSLNATFPGAEACNMNIPVGTEPFGIAFDSADSQDYVANEGSNNVTVIFGNGAQAGSVSVGTAPREAVWDQAKLAVCVTNYGSGNVSEIRGLHVVGTVTGPSGSEFLGSAYDEATDQLFVTGYNDGEVYVYGSAEASVGPVTDGTSCTVFFPGLPAYDPVDHDIYVPSEEASLSILNGACQNVANISFSKDADPAAAAFDPANNMVYVTDFHLNRVYVILGTKLVTTIKSTTFDGPSAVAFDPGDGIMAVSNGGSNTVTFLLGTTVLDTTTVGNSPGGFAYDPYYGRFLVSNGGGSNVASLNAVTPLAESDNINIAVGTAPEGVSFDDSNSLDYVSNSGGSSVTVTYGNGLQIGSVSVGTSPVAVAWDPTKLSIYVVNSGSNNVSVIQGLTVMRTIAGPIESVLDGIAYDEGTDQVFVTAFESGEVIIYN